MLRAEIWHLLGDTVLQLGGARMAHVLGNLLSATSPVHSGFHKSWLRIGSSCALLLLLVSIGHQARAQTSFQDLLKKAQQAIQKPSNTKSQQPAQSNQSKPAEQPSTAADTIPDPTEADLSAGKGPDAIGLRVGMTPGQARSIVKARGFPTTSPGYNALFKTLAVTNPKNGLLQPIAGADYIDSINSARNSRTSSDDYESHSVHVSFAPVPHHQDVVAIFVGNNWAGNKRPAFDTFEKAIIEKYGTPTFSSKGNGYVVFQWGYDTNGAPMKPGSFKDKKFGCEELQKLNETGSNYGGFVLDVVGYKYPTVSKETLAAQCAPIFAGMQLWYDRNLLVNSQNTRIINIDASLRALHAARAIMSKAQAGVNDAATQQGRQQKPDL